jgi:hypothetical protein
MVKRYMKDYFKERNLMFKLPKVSSSEDNKEPAPTTTLTAEEKDIIISLLERRLAEIIQLLKSQQLDTQDNLDTAYDMTQTMIHKIRYKL